MRPNDRCAWVASCLAAVIPAYWANLQGDIIHFLLFFGICFQLLEEQQTVTSCHLFLGERADPPANPPSIYSGDLTIHLANLKQLNAAGRHWSRL